MFVAITADDAAIFAVVVVDDADVVVVEVDDAVGGMGTLRTEFFSEFFQRPIWFGPMFCFTLLTRCRRSRQ